MCVYLCVCVCVPQLYENAKLLVCCADSLFGLDVRRRCVVLSSLQVPSHFFTQKSAFTTSGIRNVAMTFFFCFGHVLGLTGRRLSLRLDPTAREHGFHPLWSLCLMFLLQACVPQRCMPFCVMKLTFFVSLPLLAFYTTFFSM